MNYLAHLFLADDTPYSLVGAILPDMTRHRRSDEIHPLILPAIKLHQRVDAFTDTHPVFARSRRRVGADHRLFSGVIVDMIYDHFLAADWSTYSDVPLDVFIEYIHDVFRKHSHLMPDPMQPRTRRMIEQGWLSSYATVDGLTARLAQMSEGLSPRLRRTVRMQDAIAELKSVWLDLSMDFHQFFRQLIGHVRSGEAIPAVSHRFRSMVNPVREALSAAPR